MSRSISSMVRCWIGVDGRCADVASASLLTKARLDDGPCAEQARRFGAVERPRRQDRVAVALGDELEDRRHRVDLHRDLRPQAERREPGLDEHADRVGPAGNDQRIERQVAQAGACAARRPLRLTLMRHSCSSRSGRASTAGDATGL